MPGITVIHGLQFLTMMLLRHLRKKEFSIRLPLTHPQKFLGTMGQPMQQMFINFRAREPVIEPLLKNRGLMQELKMHC